MKVNRVTAGVLVVFVLGIAALAAWGEQLGMSAEALTWVQTAAGVIGATVLAMLPRLLEDRDGDGIPDIIEKGGPLLVLALLGASTLTGCVPAIRGHATTAHGLHEGLSLAGATISGVTREQLAVCPHDDGEPRMHCIDRIERVNTAAAAVRDAMIAPVDAYRAMTLSACGIDPADPEAIAPDDCPDPGPDAMAQIETAALAAVHDLPALLAALRVLGAPIPAGLLLGGR